jgi:ribosomal protein S27AE
MMMSTRSLASVAFTIIGVLAILYSIFLLQGVLFIPLITYEGSLWPLYCTRLLTLALVLGLGLFLILRRERLAAWISQDDEVPVQAADDASKQVARAAGPSAGVTALVFALLGLYLMIMTLTGLGSLAAQLIMWRETPGLIGMETSFLERNAYSIGQYLATLAQLLIGGYLFIDACRFGGWWHRRRRVASAQTEASVHRCPECGTPFDPADYSDDSERWLCSRCRSVLPAHE